MSSSKRQHIERVPGARRAKLTPAPGTTQEPADAEDAASDSPTASGPNDDRLRQDVPPHY